MKKSLIGICAALFCAASGATFAAPAITGVSASGGSLVDGATVQVSGSGFGSNPLDFKWLGGSTGVIEAGTTGATPANAAGWLFNDGAGCNTTIATSQAHSGTKSLYCSLNTNNRFNGAVRYDYGRDIGPNEDIFVSWWVRRTHVGDGQWKMFRINYKNDITDDSPQAVLFNWYNSSQFFVRIDFSSLDPSSWGPPYPKEDNRWYRMDFRVHTSNIGQADGVYQVTLHDPTTGKIQSVTVNGMTYASTARSYRWFLWQNYVGNGVTSQEVWMDDLFVQVGSQARVELCDKPQWSNCTFREIQPPSSWSDGTVAVKLNRGAFKSGEVAYLYLVDGSGAVSNGLPVTIGGGITAPAASPMPPGGFIVN